MREVSSTSPISAASRFVSSAISARNASRCSALSKRQRSCSVRAAPITAAIGLRSSCETSETKSARSAERRRSSSTRLPLGLVRADVLHGRRDEAAEQRDELDLLVA